MEVHASARLFGGRRQLLQKIHAECATLGVITLAVAPTALACLALLRHQLAQECAGDLSKPRAISCAAGQLMARLDTMPLHCLSVAAQHGLTLSQIGCRTLGQVRALPRGGLSRRFGAALLDALDRAYGLKTEIYGWLVLPEHFDVRLEFLGRIEVAEGLMFGANRLLLQLQVWLQARQRGVTGVILHWEHDLQRRSEAKHGAIEVKTGEATRDMQHIAKLLFENLSKINLTAPVVGIRLEASGIEDMQNMSASLLPDARIAGESVVQLLERLAARLGADRVLRGALRADHRPQNMQAWEPATAKPERVVTGLLPDVLTSQPPWILRRPIELAVVRDRPVYQGPLALLAGPERIESGWWATVGHGNLTLRDYFIAASENAGLLWIYRQRAEANATWFLHGIYG